MLLVACGFGATPALAQPGLLIGVSEDQLKWARNQEPLQTAIVDLGLQAVRITQVWPQGEPRISLANLGDIQRAVSGAKGTEARIVLSVYGAPAAAPQDVTARTQYCSYVRSILARVPEIHDVVIWNEVNSSMFWRPQFNRDGSAAAPWAYEALLEACYGTLHVARPGLNVITSLAPRGNDDPRFTKAVTNAPTTFVRQLGAAYRASGRQVKIFDTFGQNVYGLNSLERPWRQHDRKGDISQGDYPRLIDALLGAFQGTRQPLPGEGGVTVWYLEDGFQTAVDPAHAKAYRGTENTANVLTPLSTIVDSPHPGDGSAAPDQAKQLTDALRLAYCQPGVGAFLNFMLADETDLGGWQSGVLWADWTRKPSFAALAAAIKQIRSGTVDCAALKGGTAGGTEATLASTRKPA